MICFSVELSLLLHDSDLLFLSLLNDIIHKKRNSRII
jgi:hypothetical protein